VRWRFTVLGQSAADDLASFRSNVDDWDSLEDHNGNSFMSTVEAAANTNTDVQWVVGSLNNTTCSANGVRVITLDPMGGDQNYIAYVSAHEAGHAHGMRHSGHDDNLTPSLPTTPMFPLMGCMPLPASEPTGPRGDDVAQAFNRFGPRATPNWGFENGLSWWTTSSNAVVASSTEYAGTGSARIPPGEWIYARIRVSEPVNYRMVARYRAASTAPTSGSIRFRTSLVGVDYTVAIPDAGCPALNNFSEGSPSQNPVDVAKYDATTAWKALPASDGDFDPITGGSEGIRGGVWVYNNTNVDILVDNVALEER
jgi:hypothetical protein